TNREGQFALSYWAPGNEDPRPWAERARAAKVVVPQNPVLSMCFTPDSRYLVLADLSHGFKYPQLEIRRLPDLGHAADVYPGRLGKPELHARVLRAQDGQTGWFVWSSQGKTMFWNGWDNPLACAGPDLAVPGRELIIDHRDQRTRVMAVGA